MNADDLTQVLSEWTRSDAGNRVSRDAALRPELAGLRIFDAPLVGIASAEDPLFESLRNPKALGSDALLPGDWLSSASSVVSCFFPFSEQVRKSNAQDCKTASDEWLHARIEGQEYLADVLERLCAKLHAEGYQALRPSGDARFALTAPYCSNWSERHVAYICGLGTFGLSKGLITERGMAGRFGSIVTDCALEPTMRAYEGLADYCIMCGACARRCPVGAIDVSKGCLEGKDHELCAPYVRASRQTGPDGTVRYGCGKCQVGVPCEAGVPGRRGQPAR